MSSNEKGQNAIEYMLLLAIVIITLIALFSPTGYFAQGLNQSLDLAVCGVEGILDNTW